MNKNSFIAAMFALLASLITVSACAGIISNDETLRYKMTVTIATPEGDRVGSAVKEALKHTEKSILPEQGGTSYQIIEGEAVIINLGEQGYVFATQTEEEARSVFKALSASSSFIVSPEDYPRFGYFFDLQQPLSIVQLWRRKACSSCPPPLPFEKSIQVKSIVFEPVKGAKITHEIIRLLPWLPNFYSKLLDGQTIMISDAKNSFANSLGAGSFLIQGRK